VWKQKTKVTEIKDDKKKGNVIGREKERKLQRKYQEREKTYRIHKKSV
jgi:hypothetical protein